MQEKDINFLEESFKKYYFDHFDLIHVPERTSEREFGFQKFNSGMTRHISLKDNKELHLLLMQNTPSDVYCSNAYYLFPNQPMNEKDWKEADLIFDIDAKDLNLDCRQDHSVTKCTDCNQVSISNNYCSKCNSTKIETKSLPCNNCIDGSKKEVFKLLNILINDLDIEKNNIEIYFSGNEGFHVYVYNSQFQELGSRERSELVDYIMFRGAIPETFGMKKLKPNRTLFPEFEENGWRGRFSKEIFGSKSKRSKIISELISSGYSNFQKKLENLSPIIGSQIDPNVTMDIHRIFRLPGSLNSKSGLSKILCTDLQKFDPYSESSFLNENTIEITANCPKEFKLKNKKFGPYYNENTTVPTFAAVYMICKNLAKIS
jgi:DNA primase small subunit